MVVRQAGDCGHVSRHKCFFTINRHFGSTFLLLTEWTLVFVFRSVLQYQCLHAFRTLRLPTTRVFFFSRVRFPLVPVSVTTHSVGVLFAIYLRRTGATEVTEIEDRADSYERRVMPRTSFALHSSGGVHHVKLKEYLPGCGVRNCSCLICLKLTVRRNWFSRPQ